MITGKIIGTESVIARLEGKAQTIRAALYRYCQEFGQSTASYIQTDKLQGQVLNHRKGHLSDSIQSDTQDTGDAIVTTISAGGAACKYAAIHEFGFDGTETVRAHLRRSREQLSVNARQRVSKFKGEIQVREFTRHMHMPERSYLRSTLEEKREAFRAGVKETMQEAMIQ
jgi:phage gpG-like protein